MAPDPRRRLLLPRTARGWAATLYFTVVWWLLVMKPVLGRVVEHAIPPDVVWVLGMPISFAYVIVVSGLTSLLIIYILRNWTLD